MMRTEWALNIDLPRNLMLYCIITFEGRNAA